MEYFSRCWLMLAVSAGLWAKSNGQFFGFPFLPLFPNPLAFWAAGGPGVGAQVPDIGLAGRGEDIRSFWPSFRSLQERSDVKAVNGTAAAASSTTTTVASAPDDKPSKNVSNNSSPVASDDNGKAPSNTRSIASGATGNAVSLPVRQGPLSVGEQRQVLNSSLTALSQNAATEMPDADTAATKLIPKRPRKRTTVRREPSKAL